MSAPARWPDFAVDLGPELEAAMEEHLAAVEAIADGPWPPTFDDTVAALERARHRLDLAEHMLDDRAGARLTDPIEALEAQMRPRLAAHKDAVGLDRRIFARIADLVARRDALGLDADQAGALDRYHRDLIRGGAALDAGAQARMRAINERLAVLRAEFRRRLLAETRDLAVRVDDVAELDGLPRAMIDAAAAAAAGDGYLLTLALPSVQPAHEFLHDRALRERLYRASVSRGRRGGEHDTRATVIEITALRAERAALLGYPSFAAYAAADETAGSVEAIAALLDEVGTAAATVARAEAEGLTAALHADGHRGPLQPWDWPYYAARERRERRHSDEGHLQQHFELGRVLREGCFAMAEQLYGLRFEPLEEAPRPEGDDVWVFGVREGDGAERGVLYLDPFARDGKGGGAWMDLLADPAPHIGQRPLVTVQLNVPHPAAGAPALLTPLEVRILFHEFGHALHALLADSAYACIGGVNVPFDVVEFPSKFHEALAYRPELLARYARHHETGVPLAAADVAALEAIVRDSAAATIVRGTANEQLDQAWHGLAVGETVTDVDAFEAAVLERCGLVVDGLDFHYRSSFFDHVFEGFYAGRHYSYLWSGVLEAIAVDWLDASGGLTRAAGARLREDVLARGALADPAAVLAGLTGRAWSAEPLLRQRGLI